MGCVVSDGPQTQTRPRSFDTRVGRIKIKVIQLFLNKVLNGTESKNDLWLKMRMSNQEHSVALKDYFNEPSQSHIYRQFVINSCHKQFGRTLAIQITNKKQSASNKNIAFGLICLNHIIENGRSEEENGDTITCSLNYYRKAAGTAELQVQFEQTSYKQLSFQLCQAYIRKAPDNPNRCYAKITVGEQTCSSEAIMFNQKEDRLVWSSSSLASFKVPSFLSQGSIQVLEKFGSEDILLGQLKLDMGRLLGSQRKLEICENIDIEDTVTGSIKVVSCKSIGDHLSLASASEQKGKKDRRTSIRLIGNSKDDQKEADEQNRNPKFEKKQKVILPPLKVQPNVRTNVQPNVLHENENGNLGVQAKNIDTIDEINGNKSVRSGSASEHELSASASCIKMEREEVTL